METKINKEYQKILDNLKKVKDYILANVTTLDALVLQRLIEECEYAFKQINTRPSLSKDADDFHNITTEMLKTYVKKNHDYGNSFEKSLDKFGLVAGVVRIGDKINRIENLTTKEAKVKDESIKDTLLDMANYCIMSVMWLNKNKYGTLG